jgi:hypothetical protein
MQPSPSHLKHKPASLLLRTESLFVAIFLLIAIAGYQVYLIIELHRNQTPDSKHV